ncbi:SAG1386/EF1546 family surface-associated protein [Lactobacillus ultunensis]|uniref:LysM domain protein n=1 Tax=Lactobacillus ultunensis DSM 16047 TaxID=525365 RepID=C2EMW6_9LACO|nr:SAG1386/EF1546 family surface-associated protein [Lactobacillus ultunensis]EEJ72135.1 LysM domain protein [Lactobacillus ultunensis DSM 16047]KRL80898.1 N-acetylmuramidase [Lactobacillus ultunensis DSM 16047]QQP27749.1 LysM peptidoglycan-binding domain-containing protein [Lactobacillus ultunensis]
MDKKSTGPYKHYERPTEKRSSQDRPSGGSARWIAVIVILAVILIALIPIVHRLAVNHSEKADEVQTVKKVSSNSTKSKKTLSTSSSKKNSVKTSSNVSSSSSKKSSAKTYVVKTGDTLTSIAQKHGLTVDQLAKLNNIEDSSNVRIGQTLKLK